MLNLFLASTVLILGASARSLPSELQKPVESAKEVFDVWVNHFNFDMGNEDYAQRYGIWKVNVEKIRDHNANDKNTWTMGVNAFTAWTWEEFQQYRLMEAQTCSATHGLGEKPIKLQQRPPSEIDWRHHKIISEVKDQGNCGSCWTFSSTGCLEAHYALNFGHLRLMSEQNLVDCAGDFDNNGCDGGLPSHAFEYIKYNGGIMTEFAYHYTATDGDCQYANTGGAVATIVDEVFNVTKYDESQLRDAVGIRGPVSIAYEVVDGFQNYDGGVYSSSVCGNTTDTVNHAVLAVGYGKDNEGVDYWTVKNSWSWEWGLEGYFYIERGSNMCGLASCASFPILPST